MKIDFNKLTYLQLKELLHSTNIIKKFPRAKALRKQNVKTLYEFIHSDFKIELFANGLYIYTRGKRCTTYAVDRCGKIIYQFQNGRSVLTDEQYGNCKWYIPLFIKAEERIEQNAAACESKACEYRFIDDDYEYSKELAYDPEQDMVETEERLKRRKTARSKLHAAMTVLTDKQREIIELMLKNDNITQSEMAIKLGIVQSAVSDRINNAIARMKNYFDNSK